MTNEGLRKAIEGSISKWQHIIDNPIKEEVCFCNLRCSLCVYFDNDCSCCILDKDHLSCFQRGTYGELFSQIENLGIDQITQEHIDLAVKYGHELIEFLTKYLEENK